MTEQANKRPPRTIGIALAITLGAFVYTAVPSLFIGFTLLLQARLRDTGIAVGTSGGQVPGGSIGFVSITAVELILWCVGAVSFAVIAVLAWQGGQPQRRLWFIGAIFVMPVWYGVLWGYRAYQDQQFLIESGAIVPSQVSSSLCGSGYVALGLITLYVVWYMSRGPARAFYRGYYLTRSETERD